MSRVVFITGASQGIGRELVRQYAELGYKVFASARNFDALTEIKSYSDKIEIAKCDVRKQEDVKAAIDGAVKVFGRIDMAILNAAISGQNSFHDFDNNNFKDLYETNVYSVVYGLELLIPLMQKQGGGIIAGVSSLADVRGFPVSGPYSSSKAALTTLLESARVELKDTNVRIVTVKPGFVITKMTDKNDFYMPQLMDVVKAVNIIIRGIESGKNRISFPKLLMILAYSIKIMPNIIYEFLAGLANRSILKKQEKVK